VLLQTFQTEHPVLQAISKHDYLLFYQHEIEERKTFYYPPFVRIVHIYLKSVDQKVLSHAAESLQNMLSHALGNNMQVLQAQPAVPERIKNQFIMQIMLKLGRNFSALQKQKILQQIELLQSNKLFTSVQITVNVDPQ